MAGNPDYVSMTSSVATLVEAQWVAVADYIHQILAFVIFFSCKRMVFLRHKNPHTYCFVKIQLSNGSNICMFVFIPGGFSSGFT